MKQFNIRCVLNNNDKTVELVAIYAMCSDEAISKAFNYFDVLLNHREYYLEVAN